MAAQTPQAGIIPEPNQHALFLVTRVNNPTTSRGAVARMVAGIPELVTAVGQHDPQAALVCTVSFGSGFWDVLSPGRRPSGLRPFTAIDLPGKSAPSTGGDILFHLISKRLDLNFELAKQIRGQLGDAIDVLDEVYGFRYLDSRDLTGFIDGTENPSGAEERAEVALSVPKSPTSPAAVTSSPNAMCIISPSGRPPHKTSRKKPSAAVRRTAKSYPTRPNPQPPISAGWS